MIDWRGARAWLALSGLLGIGSLIAWWLPAPLLDWQPGLAFSEPWRAWTAAYVHWSRLHFVANLGALAVVAVFGVAAQLPARAAVAWCAAWPLTQFGLLVEPALLHYGGLSGVLHAAVAAAVLWLVVDARGGRRTIGAMVFIGFIVKLLLEEPWGPPLRHGDGWDIAVSPIAHATGAVAGWLCTAVALATRPPANR